MKNLSNYIILENLNNEIINEFCNICAEETINESFKSSLLTSLATKISKTFTNGNSGIVHEKPHNFMSFFGPIYVDNKKDGVIIFGVKWDTIKDKDFTLYKKGDKENLINVIKSEFKLKKDQKSIKTGLFIACEPGSKDPVLFAQGWHHQVSRYDDDNDSTDKDGVNVYSFDDYTTISGEKTDFLKTVIKNNKVKKEYNISRHRGKYAYTFSPDDLYQLLQGFDVYYIEITDEMVDQYKTLINNRDAKKEGIVPTDETSLKALTKRQQAELKLMARQKRLEELKKDGKSIPEMFAEIYKALGEAFIEVGKQPNQFHALTDLTMLSHMITDISHELIYFSREIDKDERKSKRRSKDNKENDTQDSSKINDKILELVDTILTHINKYKKGAKYSRIDIYDLEKSLYEIFKDMNKLTKGYGSYFGFRPFGF